MSSLEMGFGKFRLKIETLSLDRLERGKFGWSYGLKACGFVRLKVNSHWMVEEEPREGIINSINSLHFIIFHY